ncbi:site-specific integrase [Bradyrhizobium oligotrophicum]|uniref:site-specific integrase n=1 Tax=Bradyrhizobium oligotrophicum TaxID=44255 RepID=UPI003EB74A8E
MSLLTTETVPDMSTSLTIQDPAHLPALLASEIEDAASLAKAEKAAATRRAYRTDFRLFNEWCASRGVGSLPASPETVAAYLASEAKGGAKPSTIARRAAAIRYAHKLASLPAPTDAESVKATMRGIRRTYSGPKAKKAPATAPRVKGMVAVTREGISGLRDRALLLIGFAGAFRRSELVALDVSDIEEVSEGLRVTIGRSKTDQEAQGRVLAIPRGDVACPVKALLTWLHAAKIESGPLFRPVNKAGMVAEARLTSQSVALIIKAYAKRAGLDPSSYAGHSLRAGFLTSAAANRASLFKMMDVSGHRSVETLRTYVRDAEIFRDHAGDGLL